MKLTTQEKIKVLEKAKVCIATSRALGICSGILLASEDLELRINYPTYDVPELLQFKPSIASIGYWWPVANKQIRYEVIDKIIAQLKAI